METKTKPPRRRSVKKRLAPPPEPKQAVVEVLPPIVKPPGVSKSIAKAMGCPTYYTGDYLQRISAGGRVHFLTTSGLEIHDWRRAYTNHLINIQQTSDLDFKTQYLRRAALSEDGRAQIEADRFEVDPTQVFGAELRLSVDRSLKPLPIVWEGTPGEWSHDENVLAWGTLDLLLLSPDGKTAYVRDTKTGHSTKNVRDEEPLFYSVLVMLNFPLVEQVYFTWEFTRDRLVKQPDPFTRDDIQGVVDTWQQLDKKQAQYVDDYNAGRPLATDAAAGLCEYCALNCTLRRKAARGELIAGPIQSEEDARIAASYYQAFSSAAKQIEEALGNWIDTHGRVLCDNDTEVAYRNSERRQFGLLKAIRAMGLELVNPECLDPLTRQLLTETAPSRSPVGDVPLNSLILSGISSYLETKPSGKRKDGGGVDRAPLKKAMMEIAKLSSSSTLVFRKTDPGLEALLQASVEQLRGGGNGSEEK